MLGLQTEIEIAEQVDATTFNVTARKALNVYSVKGGQTRSRPQDPILNGGMQNLSDPTEPAPGLPELSLTIEAPLCVTQLQFWLRAFFGAPATTGSAPNHSHLFKTGVAVLPYISIQHKLQANDFRKYVGLVGESMEISLNPEADGFGRITMTFIGIEEQRAVATAAGTVTAAPTLDRPAEALSNIIFNGVSGGSSIGGKLSFKRKIKRVRSADGTGKPRAVQYDGKSEVTGSLKCRYESQTMLADAWAQTERAITLELLKSATRGVRFAIAHALLDEVPVSIDGPDGVEFDLPFTGYQTTVDPALQVTALSATASLATL